MAAKNIYDFVQQEEIAYQTLPVTITDNYEWSMQTHVNTTILYKNSKYVSGSREDKPFKNITRPILNLQYRSEGFDLKDITLFVNDPDKYYMSFLVRKFHEKWARENKIDTFIDKLVESYVDFGGALVKNVNQVKPEVVPFQSIAFCDQTDIMSGPIALKHFYSPDQLLAMASKGWGNPSRGATATLQEVITLSENWKTGQMVSGVKSKTPGKYIEIYEVHGTLPNEWLKTGDQSEEVNDEPSDQEYSPQLHIITLYVDEAGNKKGITLFKGAEKQEIFKLILRDEIYGRALGLGGAEELFEPQVWVNYGVQRTYGMLDSASKMLFQTTDPAFANRNKTSDLEDGEILIVAPDSEIVQINTQPVNIVAFENSIKEWEAHAQQMGAANDTIMGEAPASGTPFKLQELVTQEAHSLHEYRQGKIADFVGEIYKDWVIPYISRAITQGQEFLASLDLDELQQIAENVVTIESNKYIKQLILSGQEIQGSQVEEYQQAVRQQFMKGGNKRFIKIIEGEMKSAPIDVEVDIAGKQKDLSGLTDKLVNIFRQLASSPQILDDPRMAKIFNQILESSGLDPIDFYQQPQPQGNAAPPPKIQETINFANLPPDGQVQMAKQAGIDISTPQVTPQLPVTTPPKAQPITK